MTAPLLRERALLQSARDVLSKTDIVDPVLTEYAAATGVMHPLASALADLQVAVDAYAKAG